MVNNSKILTVSYGTFSCTLEGFEDSFGTMKAIAEYFRDLAADDRYFGAEPPQPDTEMLARIAQREIARQVEARTDSSGKGVILRAGDYIGAGSALPAAVTAPVTERAPTAQSTPAAPVATEPTEEAQPIAVTAPQAETAPATPTVDEPAEEASTAGEPVIEEFEAESVSISAETAAPDSIAAKLQRIRAVVSHNTAPGVSEFAEDEHADAFMSETVRDLSLAIEEDDATEIEKAQEKAAPAEAQDELSAVLDRYDAMSDEPESASPRTADTVDYDESYDDGQQDGGDADVLSLLNAIQSSAEIEDNTVEADGMSDQVLPDTGPDADDDDLGSTQGDTYDLDDDEDFDLYTEDDASNAIDLSGYEISDEISPEVEDSEEPAIFDDLDSLDDDDDLDQDELRNILEDEEEPASDRGRPSSLSYQEEEDLLRELAEVEAETALSSHDSDDEDEEEYLETGAAVLASTEEADDDLPRLMAAAEAKMGTEESSTNRETYSQLRAAVAAAKAERSAGGDVDDDEDDDIYREDLASVVRPRRPVAPAGQRPQRPETMTRPAPLKLVAEQRIDLEEESSRRGPVRPRRVSASEEARGDSSNTGFAKYAAEMGATDLPDLLEAAASYLSFVEGVDQFSRPQLMRKLRQLENHDFNREDGLRSFGQLLRQGKIEKTGAGRFTASGDIGFRPDAREAG